MLFLASLLFSLLVSMFFSASEAALLSLNRYQIQSERATWTNKLLIKLLDRIDEVLILILMGNTFANIWSASMMSFYLTEHDFSPELVWLAPLFLTMIILIFAEVIPKTLATFQPKKVAGLCSWLLNVLLFLLYPAIWIIKHFNQWFLRSIGVNSTHVNQKISFKEYKSMIAEGLKHEQTSYQHMMLSVLELHELTVNHVMVARSKIEMIDLKQSIEHIENFLMHSRHRWVPIVEGSLDQILGFVRIQACIPFLVSKTLTMGKLKELMIEPYFIPEKTPLSVQYRHFHREFRKIGLVVDEYGGLLGLMSIEDILNHLSVEDFSLMESSVYKESTHEWIIPGELTLSAFRRVTGVEIYCELATTIGGALIEHFEYVPDAGTDLIIDEITYEVLQTSRQQILKIRVTLPRSILEESTGHDD